MAKRTEYTCDQCGESQDEQDAKHYHWLHVIRHKKFDAHFCSIACLTSWLAAGYGDGTDPNQTRFETDTAGNVSVTFDAEDAPVLTEAARIMRSSPVTAQSRRAEIMQNLEQAWTEQGVTFTRNAQIPIPAGE